MVYGSGIKQTRYPPERLLRAMIRYDASRSRLRNRRGLGYYFEIVPTAKVTGIDLPFEENAFDAAVSVESLHLFGRGPEQVGADLYAEGGQIMTDPAMPAAPAGI